MPTSSSYFTRRQKSNTNPQKPSSSSIMKSSNGSQTTRNDNQINKVVRYKECRKNHAANIGGYAVDGCREFMASGLEGTNEAFICAACTCHRSFHKREVENQVLVLDCSSRSNSDDS